MVRAFAVLWQCYCTCLRFTVNPQAGTPVPHKLHKPRKQLQAPRLQATSKYKGRRLAASAPRPLDFPNTVIHGNHTRNSYKLKAASCKGGNCPELHAAKYRRRGRSEFTAPAPKQLRSEQ